MSCTDSLLSGINGGRVLDAGCGAGRFTRLLAETLCGVESVVGVDTNKDSLDEARRQTDDRRITYRMLDIMDLAVEPARFDTVAIGYSLHHVAHPKEVLQRLTSVLVPGAALIINEPCSDGLSAAQQNGRDVHHLKSRIDRLRGLEHRATYTADEIRALVATAGVEITGECSEAPDDDRPADEQNDEVMDFLKEYVGFAEGHPEYDEIRAFRADLQARIEADGIRSPTHLLILARKPFAGD